MIVAQPFVNRSCYCECSKSCVCTRCRGKRISFVVYDFGWRESIVMWWGGLRGAVGLALGLIVGEDVYWGEDAKYGQIPGSVKSFYKDAILYHVGVVAGLTLMINGVTMGPLVSALGLSKKPGEIAIHNFERILHELDTALEKKIADLQIGSTRVAHHHKNHHLIPKISEVVIVEPVEAPYVTERNVKKGTNGARALTMIPTRL